MHGSVWRVRGTTGGPLFCALFVLWRVLEECFELGFEGKALWLFSSGGAEGAFTPSPAVAFEEKRLEGLFTRY